VIFPNSGEFAVCFFVVTCELFQTSRVVPVKGSGDYFIIVDGHHIVAPHVVVSLEKVKPRTHPIPFRFVLPKDGAGSSFTTDLFQASIKGSILFLKVILGDPYSWEETEDFVSVFVIDVEEFPVD
jgi:hypothetical protein